MGGLCFQQLKGTQLPLCFRFTGIHRPLQMGIWHSGLSVHVHVPHTQIHTVCIHICTHTHTHTCKHAHINTCTHKHINTCTHTHTYTHARTVKLNILGQKRFWGVIECFEKTSSEFGDICTCTYAPPPSPICIVNHHVITNTVHHFIFIQIQ